MKYPGLVRSASISPCGNYRWWLKRSWQKDLLDEDKGTVCFIMLNPSTADAEVDDPTIRRCMAFAKSWGFYNLEIRNLYAFRSTSPKKLFTAIDPVGPKGDYELAEAKESDLVVAAWGIGAKKNRVDQVMRIFFDEPLYCLGTTKNGHPKHPLYVMADTELVRFEGPR